MTKAISIHKLNKIYDNGFQALNDINLDVQNGEIFALLGPNGAGKTTLINSICGIVRFNNGTVKINGLDNIKDYRLARSHVGLVPQELNTDAFETVWDTVSFSRGLFGKPASPAHIEQTLKTLSLWDKKGTEIRKLSGGMKRRVMIAKALSHEPKILFLDEPSAGVDVELRKSMWEKVRDLKENGVTIILTTHYIEEAEEMADRVGIINQGKLLLIEEKKKLMKKLGKKELVISISKPLTSVPASLEKFNLELSNEGKQLIFTYDSAKKDYVVTELLECLKKNKIQCVDLDTHHSSLEDIFVKLVGKS